MPVSMPPSPTAARGERLSHSAETYLRTGTAATSKRKAGSHAAKMDLLLASTVTFKRKIIDVMDNKHAVGLMVERSRGSGKLTVRFETEDVTATSGLNYVGGGGTVVFKHGDKVASVQIPLYDTDFEDGETVKTFKADFFFTAEKNPSQK